MNNRNTIIISSLTLIIGIAIGRLTATPTTDNLPTKPEPLAIAPQPKAASESNSNKPTAMATDTEKNLTESAKTAFGERSSTAPAAPTASPQEPANNNRNNTYDGSAEGAAKNYPNEITAEEIDRVLPAPFNNSLKHTHGFLREKYKDFVTNTQPNDWDTRMQNKISDFIFSSPYSKYINIESLLCKSGLCEIRLFETKQGTFSAILSEMALQDWWDIGGYHASGSGADDGRTAYHVLLPRK